MTGIVYTHSHADHFGGVKGFVSQEDVDAGRVRIFPPEGFIEHAVSENVFAGTAMNVILADFDGHTAERFRLRLANGVDLQLGEAAAGERPPSSSRSGRA